MKATVFDFRQDRLLEVGLGLPEVVVLDWLLRFAQSGRQRFVDIGLVRYYWVDYKKVFDDLPILQVSSPRQIKRFFRNLVAARILDGRQVARRTTTGGSSTYYAISAERIEWLTTSGEVREKETTMSSLGLSDAREPSAKLRRARKLRPEVLSLIEEALAVVSRGRAVFRNTAPEDDQHYTKALEHFAEKVTAIYDGRWFREYPINPLFISRNSHLINDESKSRIRAAKGSWTAVRDLVWGAVKNYRKWFWAEREPETKDWLPRDLSDWMYSERNQTSLFFACVVFEPDLAREKKLDRIYESLPEEVIDRAEQLLNPEWDESDFWTRVRNVCRWYQVVKADLCRSDNGARYWFGRGLAEWFGKYVDWLSRLAGDNPRGLYLKQVGPGNPTWAAWCTAAASQHKIRADIPINLNVSVD